MCIIISDDDVDLLKIEIRPVKCPTLDTWTSSLVSVLEYMMKIMHFSERVFSLETGN